MSNTTPVGQTLGTMANRIPSLVAHSAVSAQESRALVLEELHGRVEYDSKCLIRKLALSDVPTKEVKAGIKAIREQKENIERYEQGMKTHDEQGGERMMAHALTQIFQAIVETVKSPDYTRHPAVMGSKAFVDVNHVVTLDRRPDVAFMEGDDYDNSWRLCAAIVEVKRRVSEGPNQKANLPDDPKLIWGQLGDVARAHMASRPFQLFSVVMIFCGWEFYLATVDRAGAVVTLPLSFIKDEELLVRAVIQIACRLDPVQLGLDSSVKLVKEPSKINDAEFTIAIGREMWLAKTCIFQSLSLVGRGTSVWIVSRVRKMKDVKQLADTTESGESEDEFVLKSTWRSVRRKSEGIIYKQIEAKLGNREWPKGLGRLQSEGKDVKGSDGRDITISHLRGSTLRSDVVLHRLLLAEVGIPIEEYKTDHQLVKGMRDAIGGHHALLELKLLHRDVSAGNILLSKNPKASGHFGFLTDFEFAKEYPPKGSVGGDMSGTAQFMAIELLDYYHNRRKGNALFDVDHHPWHDLESFVWVFFYAIVVHQGALKRQQSIDARNTPEFEQLNQEWTDLRMAIQNYWARTTFMTVSNMRRRLLTTSFREFPGLNVPLPLQRCVQRMMGRLWQTYPPVDFWEAPVVLTHEFLTDALDRALVELGPE